MKEKRTFIYISHPFSADPEHNRRKASDITGELARKCGVNLFIFINPLDLFLGQSQTLESDRWISSQAIEAMLKCDGVIFCDGWRKSRGCRVEHFAAHKTGLPRWLGVDAFLANLEQHEDLCEDKGCLDEIGGYHEAGCGWQPNGAFCGECSKMSCVGCPVPKEREAV